MMMHSNVMPFVCSAVLYCLLQFTVAAPSVKSSLLQKIRQRRSEEEEDRSSFTCPRVTCPELGACEEIEVVVWMYGTQLCEGCPYCLDLPEMNDLFVDRGKRDVTSVESMSSDADSLTSPSHLENNEPIAKESKCSHVSCPTPRPEVSCDEKGILDGYLKGTRCISCAFCADPPADDWGDH